MNTCSSLSTDAYINRNSKEGQETKHSFKTLWSSFSTWLMGQYNLCVLDVMHLVYCILEVCRAFATVKNS